MTASRQETTRARRDAPGEDIPILRAAHPASQHPTAGCARLPEIIELFPPVSHNFNHIGRPERAGGEEPDGRLQDHVPPQPWQRTPLWPTNTNPS